MSDKSKKETMTLPSFVGIGGERCGSTWLHTLLQQHPKIYVPVKRKELDFFNFNYEKGLEWYESFFPNSEQAKTYQAIGEISPRYLNFPQYAQRLTTIESINKLLIILRNPVNRAYSHYGHTIRLRGYSKSFEEFIIDYPNTITHGFYGDHLEAFLQYYRKDQVCCLIFEEAIADVISTKHNIAQFLDIDPNEFGEKAGIEKINETYIPKLKKLNRIASRIRSHLRKSNLDWLINLAKQTGFQEVLKLGADQRLPPMQQETYLRLQDVFARDIENLEKLLGINLDLWRS
ncbi:MAG TPA: hypothetical protein DD379_22825 [Cyanobacteria bacterium UBA11162]|nr:hypothetical protein [Cyanobacteria bacterium UBA11162]